MIGFSNGDGGMQGNATGKPPVEQTNPGNLTERPPKPREWV